MAHVFRPITEPSERETMPSRIAFYSQLLKHNTVAGVNSNSLNIFWSLVALTTGCNVQYVESLLSPRGHYFASASHDRTARLWSTDRPRLLRIFAGQVSDVNVWEKFVVISYKQDGQLRDKLILVDKVPAVRASWWCKAWKKEIRRKRNFWRLYFRQFL